MACNGADNLWKFWKTQPKKPKNNNISFVEKVAKSLFAKAKINSFALLQARSDVPWKNTVRKKLKFDATIFPFFNLIKLCSQKVEPRFF